MPQLSGIPGFSDVRVANLQDGTVCPYVAGASRSAIRQRDRPGKGGAAGGLIAHNPAQSVSGCLALFQCQCVGVCMV